MNIEGRNEFKKVKLCSQCGHPMPDPSAANLNTWTRRKLYEFVRDAGPEGITMRDLIDKLYADRSDGGPAHASKIVSTEVVRINRQIAKYGVKIRCGQNQNFFRLLPL